MTNEKLSLEFKSYEKEIKKHNLFLSDFDSLESNYEIEMTQKTYEKLGRKYFPKKATKETAEKITARQYACYMTSVGFFKDKVYKSYTTLGYKPTRIVCVNPTNETKIERIFKFTMKQR